MEDGELVGIITSNDVMGVLLQAIGMSDDSMRLSVFVKDTMGTLAEVTEALKNAAVNIQSLISYPEKDHPGVSQLVLRVANQDSEKAIGALQAKNFIVKSEYTKDISEFLPV